VPVSEIQLTGQISKLAGSCPTWKFEVSGRTVFATSSTIYMRGPCASLSNDTPVTIEGWLMSDNTVRADRVRIEK